MEDLMKSFFETFRDTYDEIDYLFIEADKEYEDQNIKSSVKGERFACRNYLSDWYSKLTEEQKKLISEFQVVFRSALVEDEYDREYNLKNYDKMNNNFQ